MAFSGWPESALDFYEGLEADNSRTYWTRHKAVYESAVHGPMAELAAELEPEFGDTKIFRPHRDLRFSKDKSPYKTACGAMIGDCYVQLSANGLAAGNGMYMMTPGQLDRYRKAVADDSSGTELEEAVAAVTAHDVTVHGRDRLKSAPRGYPADHPRIDLLRNKGLIAWKEWPVEPWLATAAAKTRLVEFMTASKPLADWLTKHVGQEPPA
jgi:uncharacterized protein (TIGR02453 family)